VLFVCTFDVIFELNPIVGELPDHLIDAACHIPTDRGDQGHGLTNMEFMRGHWEFVFGQALWATLTLLGLHLLLLDDGLGAFGHYRRDETTPLRQPQPTPYARGRPD
jgi:hypothetical protein